MVQAPAFTSRYNGLSNTLVNEVMVTGDILDISKTKFDISKINNASYKALWDTGATNSVITQDIVDGLSLKPIGMTKVHTASHTVDAEVYMISILLPNKICIPNLRVTKGNITGYPMLIGMDVINKGDFAVTHHQGKTSFSFRSPSLCEIDFTKQTMPADPRMRKVPRNDPCPCGSGKKYKKCHG